MTRRLGCGGGLGGRSSKAYRPRIPFVYGLAPGSKPRGIGNPVQVAAARQRATAFRQASGTTGLARGAPAYCISPTHKRRQSAHAVLARVNSRLIGASTKGVFLVSWD
jgi:hypothetical protein